MDEMVSNNVKKLPRANDFDVLAELRKMALIASNQVVGPSGICAFNKDIVGGIGGDFRQACWNVNCV
jgi:hypothetical protein